jgi:hypothetical protein
MWHKRCNQYSCYWNQQFSHLHKVKNTETAHLATPPHATNCAQFRYPCRMNRENETGVKTGKITPYKIFGWVPLSLFFIAAGTMAFFGFLKGL